LILTLLVIGGDVKLGNLTPLFRVYEPSDLDIGHWLLGSRDIHEKC